MKLVAVPISWREACAWIERVHRHHKPPRGLKFAIAASVGGKVVGVATAGRPSSRARDDGWTLEVTRVATDGTRNACSFLYGAVLRAGRAMGYTSFVTYTLPEEGGASLRAAGWRLVGETEGRTWSRVDRPRVDAEHQLQYKLVWFHD